MDLKLRGKRALLLASSKGLGRAAAQALAGEGAAVVISASNLDRCRETAAAISQAHGTTAVPIRADMFVPESMDRLFEQAQAALGGVDILFINHPGPALGLAQDIDVTVLERQFRLMLASPIRLISRALPAMRERRWGRILSVGGAGMVTPLPNKAMDDTLRPALAGYSKALANEVAADGVTVNIILPRTFVTDRVRHSTAANAALWGVSVEEAMRRRIEGIAAGRFGELEEFGAVAAFLCSDAASYVNGSIVRVDGSQIKSVF
ncbi:MAG: SDR family oxidoreductase [Burkholderiales bacterium]|nr:SDR family oxidoreductase [Burkholderiales bacterium]